jgi:hypothetical protein
MPLPTAFSNNATPTGPQLDGDLNALGSLVTIQCTATGTNALQLTPTVNAPAVTSYGAGQPYRFGFTAPNTTTGAVVAAVSGLSALPIYMPNGAQATAGNLTSGTYYEIVYVASYNTGAGGWQLVSATPATAAVPYGIGSSQGLKITNDSGVPNTKIDVTAQGALFITASGTPLYLAGISFVIDLTTGTGTAAANGMDGETRPTNGWVYLYMISNGSVAAGLGSLVSPTTGNAPTLPTGYTYYFYVGAMFLNASQNLLGSRQLGPLAQYIVGGANLTGLPTLASNSFAGTTLTSVTMVGHQLQVTGSSFTNPLTAGATRLLLNVSGAGVSVAVAPNNNYSGFALNPPFVNSSPTSTTYAEVVLETNSVYYATTGTTALQVTVLGWTDYWSK